MRALRSVGRVLYDLIVGDDWKVAAAVAISLLAGALVVTVSAARWVPPVIGSVLGAAFTISVIIDVRRYRRQFPIPKPSPNPTSSEESR